ncbi:MAG: glycosyltransferase [Patescibacteria group bacterium]|nr:glycosyltransferase [Patescibacteria group bacterium]MDD5491030.1 glycosyltransferase [Patescibacteria group bacterium]
MTETAKVSIIMPTLNSSSTIRKALESIRKQKYDQSLVEILVIDAGSYDQTKKIAAEYGCKILPNPKTQQEYAKHIGILSASGSVGIFLDSDEVLSNDLAIKRRVDILSGNSSLKVVHSGGYKKPAGFSSVNDYINNFSDPFVFFMYGISSQYPFFLDCWKRKYLYTGESESFVSFKFKKNDAIPVVDMCAGNAMDLDYFREKFKDILQDEKIVPRIFYLIVGDGKEVALLKNDFIIHYSADSYKKFINKIKWRVIVNLHYREMPGTGFSNREEFQPRWFRFKKYLFIPYSLSIILPFASAAYFSIKRKKPVLMVHLPLTFYTACIILCQYFLKILGIKPKIKTYGNEERELVIN